MTCWPHTDTPGAGLLDECELDAACDRKRVINLTVEQLRAVDDTAGLCGVCGGACPVPSACERAENVSGFPLEPYFRRHSWLGPLMLALVSFVWLCLDSYLELAP